LDWMVDQPLGYQDGPIAQARFNLHVAGFMELSPTQLLASDYSNHRLRLITLGVAPLVTIAPTNSLFTNSVTVSVSNAVPGGVVRYTLDGSNPTPVSPAYGGSFQLNTAATVKAAVFVNDSPVSGVLTQAYARVYALDDGIPASWREQYFGADYATDPRVAWDADPDSDGANNLQEYVAGTDPLDALSGFRVGLRMAPVVTWSSVVNRTYRVLRKDSLSQANWTVVAPSIVATNSVSTFVDLDASSPRGFYVIEVVP
ncbi:MAG: chitobiase/beta-hexosaminidase C-terminal domain-containing protein, partial [Pedosphaera parvula]|nr:chitobiase/beta-hexosaminidase C-terminal domain-containing protein [Pedosphaera parvula]